MKRDVLFYPLLLKAKGQSWYARNLIVFILAVCLQGVAYGGSLTEVKVSVNYQNMSLAEVLKDLKKQSGYGFFYEKNDLDENFRVSLNLGKANLKEALRKVLAETQLDFKLKGEVIVIFKKEKRDSKRATVPMQENKPVKGKVVDETGEPLVGVNVYIKGTSKGIMTDVDGAFSIDAKSSSVLVFSYIGYQTKEVLVGNQSVVNVRLAADVQQLDELVVIGYGEVKKKSLTGAVSVVDKDVLSSRPSASTTQLLQGVAPGLIITRSNAGRIAGSGMKINIRGATSRANPGVLIVVDGIPQSSTDAGALDQINPDDIESINVLKDAQAAIYGSRAAGGVIVVTTKTGQTIKPTINASVSYTYNQPDFNYEATDLIKYLETHNNAYLNDGQKVNMFTDSWNFVRDNNITVDDLKKNDYKYTFPWPYDNTGALFVYSHKDWQDIVFQRALMKNYNISASGKTDKMNYYASVGFVDQDGMVSVGTNYNKRIFMRSKVSYDLTDYLKIRTNLSFERQKVTEPTNYDDAQNWAGMHMPWAPVYNLEGKYYNFGVYGNPYATLKEGGDKTAINNRAKVVLGADLTPIKDLVIRGEVALNYDMLDLQWAQTAYDLYDWRGNFSRTVNHIQKAGHDLVKQNQVVANVYATYKKTIQEKHNVSLMVGYSHEESDSTRVRARREGGLISPALPTMGIGDADKQFNSEVKRDLALRSLYSRFTYDYDDRYLIEATYRNDGSSRFAKGYRWAPFYCISAAWNITNEPFMQGIDSKILSFMKLRASYGQMGNQASVGRYDFVSQVNIGGQYPFGNSDSPTKTQNASIYQLASPDRTWETVHIKNIGMDVAVLDSRLSANFDYFVKDTKDMFFAKEYPAVIGIRTPTINGAHLQTWGWELTMQYKDQIGDFKYYAGFNLSNSDDKIIDLKDAVVPKYKENKFLDGHAVGSYYVYKYDGIIQNEKELEEYKAKFKKTSNGLPNQLSVGDARYVDLDGDGVLEERAYKVDENGNPTEDSGDLFNPQNSSIDFQYGINLGVEWKGISISTQLQGVAEWYVFDNNRPLNHWAHSVKKYQYGENWTPENTGARYPRASHNDAVKVYNNLMSDAPYKLYNNAYLRMKTLRVGYSLPEAIVGKVGLQRVSLYFVGTDIWDIYTNIPGASDVESPFAPKTTPFPRSYSFGVNITL